MVADASVRARLRKRAADGDAKGAAEEALALGDPDEASRLYEHACEFESAARAAEAARDWIRALELALLAGARELARELRASVVGAASPDELALAAARLLGKGFGSDAGELFAAAGRAIEAGRAFADAGEPLRAAEAFERGEQPAEAAKALERGLALDAARHDLSLALGSLLARHGRDRQAVRALQAIPAGAPERRTALPVLRAVLERLGLRSALDDLDREMLESGAEATPALPAPAPRERLFGLYDVEAEIAVTPHARIVRARDLTGAEVAVKVFASVALEHGRDALVRFENEARALARLRHPHVVGFRGYHPEGPAIAMEWMTGGSLADRLSEPIAPARAAEIAGAVLMALGEAHRMGILHRDVKPSNVLFDGIGTPRLGDFGAAHLGDLSATATAARIGTLAFMSPEQRLGRPATVRSDVFGAGMLLVTMLYGEPLASSARPPASTAHPDLAAEHDELLSFLTAEDAAARPADAFEARRALSGVAWPARALPSPVHRRRPSSRPPAAPAGEGRLRAVTVLLREGRAIDVVEDEWTGRRIWLVPLGPEPEGEIARARAFARADHAALVSVLRLEAERLWVEAPPADAIPCADDPELGRVREALLAVGCPGAVLALRTPEGRLVVAYPLRSEVVLPQGA